MLLVAVCYRTNLTMRQLAPLFCVSPATVCRVIQRLGPLLALEPGLFIGRLRGAVVDCGRHTDLPVCDRKVGVLSRNYRFSANVLVIVDTETRVVIAAARTVPGTTADAKARRHSGLAERCQGVTVLGDGACINTGLVVRTANAPDGRC